MSSHPSSRLFHFCLIAALILLSPFLQRRKSSMYENWDLNSKANNCLFQLASPWNLGLESWEIIRPTTFRAVVQTTAGISGSGHLTGCQTRAHQKGGCPWALQSDHIHSGGILLMLQCVYVHMIQSRGISVGERRWLQEENSWVLRCREEWDGSSAFWIKEQR